MTRPSRGIVSFVVLVAAALVAVATLVHAPSAFAATSAVGLVDFSSRTPNFKNGDWVRYRFETESSSGEESAGYQELRVVGEETYRGEKCFWLETGVGRDTLSLFRTVMLVSYEAFKDPNADVRFKRYMRLFMMGPAVNMSGPEILEVEQPKESAPPTADEIAYLRGKVDTLGTVTIDTERGPIPSRQLYTWRKIGATDPQADSTVQMITDTKRTVSKSRRVPITSQTSFEQTETTLRKAYANGAVSTDAPESVVGWTKINSTVVAWGKGATNMMLEAWRKQGSLLEAPVNSP